MLRTRMSMAVACILAGLAMAAGPAAAAGPWSPAAAIPGADAGVAAPNGPPVVASDASGPRAVYWLNSGLLTAAPYRVAPASFVSALGPGLVPQPAQRLAPDFQLDAGAGVPIVDGRGRVVLAALAAPGGGHVIATGPITGPLRLRPLADLRAIAANAAGDVAAVVEPCNTRTPDCHPAAPRLMLGRRGRRLGAPVALDRKGRGHSVAVAIDRRGRVLAAWDRDGSVYARAVSPAGRLGTVRRVGSATHTPTVGAVLSDDGRAAVSWTQQDVSEGFASSPFTARVALADATGRFAPAKLLGTVRVTGADRFVQRPGVVVRLVAGHPGLVAWTDHDGRHLIVRAASIRGTRVGAGQTVSQAGTDTVLADAAEGPHGEQVVLLLPGRSGAFTPPGQGGLAAATRAPTAAAFGAPEPIVPAPVDVESASAGIDAATGTTVAAWLSTTIEWSVRAPIA